MNNITVIIYASKFIEEKKHISQNLILFFL
jgi:hypothetical protein